MSPVSELTITVFSRVFLLDASLTDIGDQIGEERERGGGVPLFIDARK